MMRTPPPARPVGPRRHVGTVSRAERRNAERKERAAAKRVKRKLFWKGVKAGDRPYTPTSMMTPLDLASALEMVVGQITLDPSEYSVNEAKAEPDADL